MASVCAAYIYKYYTHKRTSRHTQEGNTHQLSDADTHAVYAHRLLYCIRTISKRVTQQGADHVRKQDKHRGNSSAHAKHAADTVS